MSDYLGVVTAAGQALIAAAIGGTPLVITDVGIGNGGGAAIVPDAAMTHLVHEVWRGPVTAGGVDPGNPEVWRFTTVVAEDAGPFDIREIALFDSHGVMVAIAAHPFMEKRTAAGGVAVSIETDIIVPISATAEVTVVIGDEDQVDLSRLLAAPFVAVESASVTAPPATPALGVIYLVPAVGASGAWAGHGGQLAQWQGDIWVFGAPAERTIIGVKGGDFLERTATGWRAAALGPRYAAATGSANALLAALDPVPISLWVGLPLFVKITAANTGPATVNVNAHGVKEIRRITGDPLMAGDLPAGAIALLVYDGVNFQLLSTIPSAAPPAASLTARGLVELATGAEVLAGADNERAVTALGLAGLTATDTRRGLIELATLAELLAGVAPDLAVTPATLAALTGTTDRRGLIELCTLAEAIAGTDTSRAVTAAGVKAVIEAVIDSAPGALNTLNELAAAMGDDPNFATTITNALALKAPLNSPAFTGNPTAPTPAAGDNDTSVATTAFATQAAQSGALTYAAAAGTANSLTAALTPAPTALATGLEIVIKAANDNSDAAELNLNGLGAKPIKSCGVDLRPGALKAGRIFHLVYEAAGDVWELIGPDYSTFDLTASAWCVFTGGAVPSILQGRGVASVSRLASGRYQVNFDEARPSAHYVVVPACYQRNTSINIDDTHGAPQTTSGFVLWMQQSNANVGNNPVDPTKVFVAVFG